MSGDDRFADHDIRLMQLLAQQVTALRPELVNCDATFGELAWNWGRGRPTSADTWRRRLWLDNGEVAGWGWAHLPYRGTRSDGTTYDADSALLTWQVHPSRPEILDQILTWYDDQTPDAGHRITVQAADTSALATLAVHGYLLDKKAAAEDGSWTQLNAASLADVAEPVLPAGYRFRSAADVSSKAAWKAHVDAWHPSTLTLAALEGAQRTWPYRPDLHVLIEAPDGTLAATAIMWLDELNKTAEFEPVGTHREYRRLGLGQALLLHGMRLAKDAGAGHMTVACLGGKAHPAAKGLYYSVGFRQFTYDVPHRKPPE